MAKKKSVDEEVALYLRNKAIELGAESYADWALKNLPDVEGNVAEKKRAKDTELYKSLSGYGKSGAELSRSGLSGSGYRNYLDSVKMRGAKNYAAALDDELLASPALGRTKYGTYVEKLAKKDERLYSDTLKSLTSAKVADYKEAYDIALESGLSDKRAREVARESTERTRTKLRRDIIKSIVQDRLSRDEAWTLATAGGLGDEEANELGMIAERLRRITTDGADLDGYVQYLKDLNKKK